MESLQSLELGSPRGDYEQILYFICQFPKLRDLKIDFIQDHANPTRNHSPRLDIKTSPPLDGTLDLYWNVELGSECNSIGAQLILSGLVALPSGLKFRTLQLSECTGDNLQLLVNACAPTLECVEFFGRGFRASFHHG